MMEGAARQPGARLEFDQRRFASIVSSRRSTLDWSMRELARRAGMSQPYVVALERGALNGPTPTVEVVARLAHALGIDPTDLFAQSLRPAGRHVLLVTDGAAPPSLDAVRRFAAPDPSGPPQWVWAASSATGRRSGAGPDATIDLRRDLTDPYDPHRIEQALDRELDAVSIDTAGHDIGFVFADTSRVMAAADEPGVLLEFERRWADVVAGCARRHGARAAWNVCVYALADLSRTSDPAGTAVDLIRSHDDVWWRHGGRAATGRSAVTSILRPLAPPGTTARAWRARVATVADEFSRVA
jgi:transcriptional regulator with XRE-family HTH domain